MFSIGKWDIIWRVPIIIQSFFVDIPRANAKNIFIVIAPVITPFAVDEADYSNFVATIINLEY